MLGVKLKMVGKKRIPSYNYRTKSYRYFSLEIIVIHYTVFLYKSVNQPLYMQSPPHQPLKYICRVYKTHNTLGNYLWGRSEHRNKYS